MNKIITLLCLTIWAITSQSLIAQTEYQYKDKFVLKNFAQIYGQLLEIKGDTVFLELEGGKSSFLLMKNLRDIKQNNDSKISESAYISILKKNILDSDKVNFFQISSAFSVGNSRFDNIIITSLASELKYKRRYHPHHFLTASYGIEVVDHHYSALLHPVTIGHQSILFPQGNTPFFNISAGYTFAHHIDEFNRNQYNLRGGLRLSTGIGMLFRTGDNTMFKTGVEWVHQQSQESRETQSFLRTTKFRNNRLLFSIGLVF